MADNTNAITVDKVVKDLGEVEVNVLTVSASFAHTGTKIELAHFNDESTNKKLSTGYVDDAGIFHEHTTVGAPQGTGNVLWGTLTVKISWNSSAFTDGKITIGTETYTEDTIKSLVQAKSVTITATPEGRARVFATNAASGDPSTAVVSSAQALTTVSTADVVWTCYGYILGDNASVDTGDTIEQKI